MKTTIKFLDTDFTYGIVVLMVGIRQVEISLNEYRMLREIANDYHSGLDFITKATNGTLFKFIPENAYGSTGYACNRLVEKIINK